MYPTTKRMILACKSAQPRAAVLEVFKEDYLLGGELGHHYGNIANILAKIVDTYQLMTPGQLFNNLLPTNDWRVAGFCAYSELSETEKYYVKSLTAFIAAIRFSELTKFGETFSDEGELGTIYGDIIL